MKTVLVLTALVGVAYGVCPLGNAWTEADGLCYRLMKKSELVKNLGKMVGYESAKEECEALSTDSCQSRLLDPANVGIVAAAYPQASIDHLWYRVDAAAATPPFEKYYTSRKPRQLIVCPPKEYSTWCLDIDTPKNVTQDRTVGVQFKTSTLAGAFQYKKKMPFICQSCGGTNYPDACANNNVNGFDQWYPLTNRSICYKINLAKNSNHKKAEANCEGLNNNRLLHGDYAGDVIGDIQSRNLYTGEETKLRFSAKPKPMQRRYVDQYDTSDVIRFPGQPLSNSTRLPWNYRVGKNANGYSVVIDTVNWLITSDAVIPNRSVYPSICQSDKQT